MDSFSSISSSTRDTTSHPAVRRHHDGDSMSADPNLTLNPVSMVTNQHNLEEVWCWEPRPPGGWRPQLTRRFCWSSYLGCPIKHKRRHSHKLDQNLDQNLLPASLMWFRKWSLHTTRLTLNKVCYCVEEWVTVLHQNQLRSDKQNTNNPAGFWPWNRTFTDEWSWKHIFLYWKMAETTSFMFPDSDLKLTTQVGEVGMFW